jgi:hypothetical protein
MTEFANYTKNLLSALLTNPKANEVISKKVEIITSVYDFHNISPRSTLFIGFNPALLAATENVSVTGIDSDTLEYVKSKNSKVNYINPDTLNEYYKKFDSVIAFDEFLTFADSDAEQQKLIQQICSLANQVVISTVRDYKNQDFKDKEFSIPAIIKGSAKSQIFLEYHDWNFKDRASWTTMVYELEYPTNNNRNHGPYNRRTMYFKQLAKFSADAGSTHFQVHKNLMYKSLLKKNYEHVISMIFD